MSICREHPMALNDGDCIDCLRGREAMWRELVGLIDRYSASALGWPNDAWDRMCELRAALGLEETNG